MRRSLAAALTALVLVVPMGPAGAAQIEEFDVSVAELLADPTKWAGEGIRVAVVGELVGDYGHRRDGWVWTQLNDDPYARAPLLEGGALSGGNIGVALRIPDGLAGGLEAVGGYRRLGPLVRAVGEWKYHDPRRGGESYIEVAALEVAERGRPLQEGADWGAVAAGIGLLALTGAVEAAARRRRR